MRRQKALLESSMTPDELDRYREEEEARKSHEVEKLTYYNNLKQTSFAAALANRGRGASVMRKKKI